jgi:hypothetical protein
MERKNASSWEPIGVRRFRHASPETRLHKVPGAEHFINFFRRVIRAGATKVRAGESGSIEIPIGE